MTATDKTLIMIPTYNEAANIEPIYRILAGLNLSVDFLFVDDNSPDGTGQIINRLTAEATNVHALHRPHKMGVGAAHQDGIRWAYKQGYQSLLTMDCDFTHSPDKVKDFLAAHDTTEIVVGSRFMNADSIKCWVWYRKFLTHAAHQVTVRVLGMPYDASGAFRYYRLDCIPQDIFTLVRDSGYSFFWESLFILWINGIKIHEISVDLPKRAYGTSNMRLRDVLNGIRRVFVTFLLKTFDRKSLLLPDSDSDTGGRANTQAEWDHYWQLKNESDGGKSGSDWYNVIARFYRIYLIRGALTHFIVKHFSQKAKLLHAGCGGGEVDSDVVNLMDVTAMDISPTALDRYRGLHASKIEVLHGSIFSILVRAESFDGVYNLGVMEHFSDEQINHILTEFHRVLKTNGRVLLFWPPSYGLSVIVLKLVHFVLNEILKKNIRLHPDEPSLIKSQAQAKQILEEAGFEMVEYYFGIRDMFTYAVVVGKKIELAQQ